MEIMQIPAFNSCIPGSTLYFFKEAHFPGIGHIHENN